MKNTILSFLVSKAGGVLTPIIAVGVAWIATRLADLDAGLAASIDQTSLTAFIVALLLSIVNYATNRAQTTGVKNIQALVNAQTDGIPGPITYTEVRRAILANQPKSEK